MHALSAEVLADSSESAFSGRQKAISIIASSSSRDRTWFFELNTPELPVLTCYESAMLPCCPSLPCYLATDRSTSRVSTTRTGPAHRYPDTSEFLHRRYYSMRMCVQQFHYRHRCGEWRTKSWRISTSRIARSDRQRCRW
jgi:hypothetical protein